MGRAKIILSEPEPKQEKANGVRKPVLTEEDQDRLEAHRQRA